MYIYLYMSMDLRLPVLTLLDCHTNVSYLRRVLQLMLAQSQLSNISHSHAAHQNHPGHPAPRPPPGLAGPRSSAYPGGGRQLAGGGGELRYAKIALHLL